VNIYVGAPHVEEELVRELSVLGARDVRRLGPGVVAAAGKFVRPVFARQVLPGARRIEGRNVDELLQSLYGALGEEEGQRWDCLGVTPIIFAPDAVRPGRGQRTHDVWRDLISDLAASGEQKRAGRRKKFGFEEAPAEGYGQLLVISGSVAYVSLTQAPAADAISDWPVPFAAGRALVRQDKAAPSSAYRKCAEAFLWLGTRFRPEDHVVDFGGAPGGWSHLAITAGARCIAVDRGAFAAELMRNGRFEHKKSDAFSWRVPEETTIFLCDIIDAPQRVWALAADILARPTVRAGVVTLKLTRPADLSFLHDVRRRVAEVTAVQARLQHLAHNKQEVTLLWRKATPQR